MVGQRAEAVRPDHRVDAPVPQARAVGAAVGEPAVVQHEPLDADPGRAVGQPQQPVQVVVEVDRLPTVEDQRARAPRVLGPGAQGDVETVGEPVEAVGGPGEVAHRGPVGLAGPQADLAGPQEFPAAQRGRVHARALRELLHEIALVPAPGDVDGPYLTRGEAEAGLADGQQVGRIDTGFAAADLAGVSAVGERAALRRPLPAPLAGEVEDLGGPAGQRKQRQRTREVVGRRVRGGVAGELGRDTEYPCGVQPVGDDDVQPGDRVGQPYAHLTATVWLPVDGGAGAGRPGGRGRAGDVAVMGGGAGPAVGLGGPQREAAGHVGGVVEYGGLGGQTQRGQVGIGQLAEVGAPVQDSGHRLGEFHAEAGAGRAQGDDSRGSGGHSGSFPGVRPDALRCGAGRPAAVAPVGTGHFLVSTALLWDCIWAKTPSFF